MTVLGTVEEVRRPQSCDLPLVVLLQGRSVSECCLQLVKLPPNWPESLFPRAAVTVAQSQASGESCRMFSKTSSGNKSSHIIFGRGHSSFDPS